MELLKGYGLDKCQYVQHGHIFYMKTVPLCQHYVSQNKHYAVKMCKDQSIVRTYNVCVLNVSGGFF